MRRLYGNRILAKARGKYGKPQYPGSINRNETKNKEKHAEEVTMECMKEVVEPVKEIWNMILEIMREEVSSVSYETWIEPCKPLSMNGNQMIIQVENGFFKEMLERRYLVYFRNAAKFVTNQAITEVKLITEEEYKCNGGTVWKK